MEHYRNRAEKRQEQEDLKNVMRVYLLDIAEASFTASHQCDYTKGSWTRVTAMNMRN